MKCSKVKKKLTAYLDKEVSEKEQRIISEHLKMCVSCQQELEALRIVTRTLAEVDAVEATPYFRIHLMTRLRDEQAGGQNAFSLLEWIRRATMPVAAAALLVFSIIAGGHLGRMMYRETAQTTQTEGTEIDYITGISGVREISSVSFSEIYEELYTGETE